MDIRTTESEYTYIPMQDLEVSEQNVRKIDKETTLDELASSMEKHGLLHPIIVERRKEGKYSIIIGQRRYLAAKMLRWKAIPAKVVDAQTKDDARTLSFSENIQRHDLSPRDKADVCKYFLDNMGSIKAVAKHLGVSELTVKKWIDFQNVPERIKEIVDTGQLSADRAVQIIKHVPKEAEAYKIASVVASEMLPPKQKAKIIREAKRAKEKEAVPILRSAAQRLEIKFSLPTIWATKMKDVSDNLEEKPSDIAKNATIEWLRVNG